MRFLNSVNQADAETLCDIINSNIEEWLDSPFCDSEEAQEIKALSDEERERHFTKLIKFGTAGLRGKMLPGTSNMNNTTVALTTYALGKLIKEEEDKNFSVVIAFDSRHKSDSFSKLCADILSAMGIKVYIFDTLRPTPELSFALRHLKCKAGINITASHNTKEYNGYKVYWEDGAQLPPTNAEKISHLIPSIKLSEIPYVSNKENITVISEEIDKEYTKNVLAQSINHDTIQTSDIGILYTPLHGAGYKLVPGVLKEAGFKNIKTVPSQSEPNGSFPTVERPNPQFIEAFYEGIKIADGCEVIIATDPDADRMGVAVRDDEGAFKALSGNEIALVLLDYIIKAKTSLGTMPENPAVVKSLVSSVLAELICKKNGIEFFNVYTGFKYIGEKIKEFEEKKNFSFLFGFEESFGYLVGTHARDKDGVVASLMIAEAAAFYKKNNLSLINALEEIYKRYGFWGEYWSEKVITAFDFKAESDKIMQELRSTPPLEIAGEKLAFVNDWLLQTRTNAKTGEKEPILSASENMLEYTLDGGTRILMRPSGTEPKIKLYYFIKADSKEAALLRLEKIKNTLGF